MARKKSRSRKAKASSGWSLSNNEYVGIVALVALFLIAAIVLKGPSLMSGGQEEVEVSAGQAAAYVDAPADDSVNHTPPPYVPPEEGPVAVVTSS